MSSANRTGIAYVEEVTWGVNPGTVHQNIDFESEGLNFGVDFVKSNSIDPSRQVKDLVQTGAEAGGDISFEFCADQYDDFLMAALFADGWDAVDGAGDTGTITAGDAASNLDFDIDVTGGASNTTLTFGSAVTHGIVEGQKFSLNGTGVTANNVGIFTATDVTGQVITVSPDFGTTEVLEAADSATVNGIMIRNGLHQTSYSIEREHGDVVQFFQYLGMTVADMMLDINEASIMTGKFGFLGKNCTLSQTTGGTGSNTAAASTEKFNTTSNIGEVLIDGTAAPSCLIKQVTIELNNNLRGNTAVGVLGFCKMIEGECDVTGTISMYFLDETMYDRYLASTPFSLSFLVEDAAGNGYSITLPKCKLSDDAVNATGKNTDVLEDASYQALMGSGGYTIQIDKFTNL